MSEKKDKLIDMAVDAYAEKRHPARWDNTWGEAGVENHRRAITHVVDFVLDNLHELITSEESRLNEHWLWGENQLGRLNRGEFIDDEIRFLKTSAQFDELVFKRLYLGEWEFPEPPKNRPVWDEKFLGRQPDAIDYGEMRRLPGGGMMRGKPNDDTIWDSLIRKYGITSFLVAVDVVKSKISFDDWIMSADSEQIRMIESELVDNYPSKGDME